MPVQLCAEGGPTGGRAKHCGCSCSMDPSNELSLCCHCHLADGAFDSRDTLVHAVSPNILAEVSKEVEKREITLRYQASMARNHRLCHSFIVGAVCL